MKTEQKNNMKSFLTRSKVILLLLLFCEFSYAAIEAVDDTVVGVDGVLGGIDVVNVFDNDTLNGVVIVPTDVTLTETIIDPNGYLTLNTDGSVDVDPSTPAGTYTLTYEICENLNISNCNEAEVSVTVSVVPSVVINSILASVCNVLGNTYSVDVDITYINAPDADLVITTDNGNSQTYWPIGTDGTETFTLTGLVSDGTQDIDVTVTYIFNGTLFTTMLDAYSAPDACGENCPNICLPIGFLKN